MLELELHWAQRKTVIRGDSPSQLIEMLRLLDDYQQAAERAVEHAPAPELDSQVLASVLASAGAEPAPASQPAKPAKVHIPARAWTKEQHTQVRELVRTFYAQEGRVTASEYARRIGVTPKRFIGWCGRRDMKDL